MKKHQKPPTLRKPIKKTTYHEILTTPHEESTKTEQNRAKPNIKRATIPKNRPKHTKAYQKTSGSTRLLPGTYLAPGTPAAAVALYLVYFKIAKIISCDTRISSKIIFASCVWYFDRAYSGFFMTSWTYIPVWGEQNLIAVELRGERRSSKPKIYWSTKYLLPYIWFRVMPTNKLK